MLLVAPPFSTGRLMLRLSPNRTGRAALDIYRPLASKGAAVKRAVALWSCAAAGRRGLDDPIVDALATRLAVPFDGACAMASSTAGRRIVGLGRAGQLVAVAKIGRADDTRLRSEAAMLARVQELVAPRVPRLLLATTVERSFVCVTEWVGGGPCVDSDQALRIAVSLGRAGWTHGDLAPWNIVGDSATVLDWESAEPVLVPMWDLAHYVIQSETLLGAGDATRVLTLLCGRSGLGSRYLTALGLDPEARRAHLIRYLGDTEDRGPDPRHRRMRSRLAAGLR
jgi:hypothetical protein